MLYVITVALLAALQTAAGRAQCVVTDEQEYAVLAAVLFPHEPDVPDSIGTDVERAAYVAARTVRLDGFHGRRYTVSNESLSRKAPADRDAELAADFNARNAGPCAWTAARLVAPPGTSVAWMSEETARTRQPGISITRVSRPGFNKARTAALVEVDLQAGPEMGVGYRVRLEKSPKSGNWIITAADLIRVY
jgi:hypothetical protein